MTLYKSKEKVGEWVNGCFDDTHLRRPSHLSTKQQQKIIINEIKV